MNVSPVDSGTIEIEGRPFSSSPARLVFNGETPAVVEAFPAQGMEFQRWGMGLNSVDNPVNVNVDCDVELVAYFVSADASDSSQEAEPAPATYESLTVLQAKEMIDTSSNLVILDVREESEYCGQYGGHIPGALNYPWNSGELQDRYMELPKDKPILVYCRSGNRSKSASSFLVEQGFVSVYEIGGIKDWEWETLDCSDAAPEVSAGPDIDVIEGEKVVFVDSVFSDPDGSIMSIFWEQVSGTMVNFSSWTAAGPYFMAPPVGSEGETLVFKLTVTDDSGVSSTDQVQVRISDNGIEGYEDDVLPWSVSGSKRFGVKTNAGDLIDFKVVDPESPDSGVDTESISGQFIYGLLDLEMKVDDVGGTAQIEIYFEEPAPENAVWFKYSAGSDSWEDFSDHALFSDDRMRMILTLVDGGDGDDDGIADGIIRDPSGLLVPYGAEDTESEEPVEPVDQRDETKPDNDAEETATGSDGGSGSGGGCFISNLL